MIRDKVVFGVCDDRTKERLIRELDLTINKALCVYRTAETSKQHIEAQALSVHTMQERRKVVVTRRKHVCQRSQATTFASTSVRRLVNIMKRVKSVSSVS